MIPPYCPNPFCRAHYPLYVAEQGTQFWVACGFYLTKVVGPVPRFRCRLCKKGFSERTFSIDYYTKKTLNNREVFRAKAEGESVSSIARTLSCSYGSAQNRLERLGRNSVLMQAKLTEGFSQLCGASGYCVGTG